LPHFDNALTLKINNDEVGFIGLLNNDLQKHYNLAQKINFAQFDLAALCKLQTKKQFCPFSRFPFISRDISLSLSNKTPFELIGNTVSEIVGDKLLNYKIVDIYRGKNKPKDKRVFSLRVYYCSPQRTLTSQEVDKIHFNLRSQLSQLAGVELR
jgi:phenylalanyl-tRNA synthetase beta chain